MSRRESKLLGEIIVLGRLREAGVDERGQLAIIVSGECDALFGGRAPADREVHTLTREHELTGRFTTFAAATASATCAQALPLPPNPPPTNEPITRTWALSSGFGEHLLNADDVLRGVVDGQARFVFRPVCQGRVQLNRIVVVWRRAVDVVHFIPRFSQSACRVAKLEIGRFSEDVRRHKQRAVSPS